MVQADSNYATEPVYWFGKAADSRESQKTCPQHISRISRGRAAPALLGRMKNGILRSGIFQTGGFFLKGLKNV